MAATTSIADTSFCNTFFVILHKTEVWKVIQSFIQEKMLMLFLFLEIASHPCSDSQVLNLVNTVFLRIAKQKRKVILFKSIRRATLTPSFQYINSVL